MMLLSILEKAEKIEVENPLGTLLIEYSEQWYLEGYQKDVSKQIQNVSV